MILYLPGFSLKNKEELESVSSSLCSSGLEVITHKWCHWSDDKVPWDLELELELIIEEIKDKKVDTIIAKSIGTFVTVHLLSRNIAKPKKVVLMGIPLNDLTSDNATFMREVLSKLENTQITIIQNTQDPHAHIETIKELTNGIKCSFVQKEASNHEYNYPAEIMEVIAE